MTTVIQKYTCHEMVKFVLTSPTINVSEVTDISIVYGEGEKDATYRVNLFDTVTGETSTVELTEKCFYKPYFYKDGDSINVVLISNKWFCNKQPISNTLDESGTVLVESFHRNTWRQIIETMFSGDNKDIIVSSFTSKEDGKHIEVEILDKEFCESLTSVVISHKHKDMKVMANVSRFGCSIISLPEALFKNPKLKVIS